MARPKRRSSHDLPAPRDVAGKAILIAATPLILGGALALTMALAGAETPVGKWLKSLVGGGSAGSRTRAIREGLAAYARGQQPFAALRNAIVGSAKGAVKTVLGPPRTARLGSTPNKLSIWRADTWYYPLDRADRSAIAIRFEGNVAREVERISVPTAMID
jgi:hypothetical protein